MQKPGLSSCLIELRNELKIVADAGKDENFRFEIGEVELELSLVAATTDEVSGGVKWYVITASAGTKIDESASQKLKIKLDVKDRTSGDRIKVSSQN